MRFRPGEIRDGVERALACAGAAGATAVEIEAFIATQMHGPVPPSSVRSYLQLNTPEKFERVTRGRYRLSTYSSYAFGSTACESDSQLVLQYGRSRLFRANSLQWLAEQPANSIQGVVTDPPYGLVEYKPDQLEKLRSGRGGTWRLPPSFDGHTRSPLPRFTTLTPNDLNQLEDFFRSFGKNLLPVLTPGAHVLMAANPLVSHLVSYALDKAGFERRGEIVRLVTTMRGGDRPKNAHDEFAGVTVMPRSNWEPWLLFRKPVEGTVAQNLRKWDTGGLRRISDEQPFGDVIRSAPTHAKERAIAKHPSLKPQAFLRQVVRAILPVGRGTVLDPFAGSGSTLAAAEAIGYHSVGVELDPHYADLARNAIPALAKYAVSDSRPVGVKVNPIRTQLGIQSDLI